MRNSVRRPRFYLLLAAVLAAACAVAGSAYAAAAAQTADGGFIHAMQMLPKDFDGEITALMAAFRNNRQAGWWLIGLSFLYGLLHAAGPGHGKAVISSYLVANNETLKRGIILAFLSSFLQALTAIILVVLIFLVFTGKNARQAATHDLEIIGSGLIMLLGLRLLWRKSAALLRRETGHAAAQRRTSGGKAAAAHTHHGGHSDDCGCHGHIVPPKAIESMDWRQALPLIVSIGIRPCTGALAVMGFALMNGLFALGAAAVLAMSFGTFLLVSALAALAVNAKQLALRLSAGSDGRMRLQSGLEWAAALFISLSGLALLSAALY